MPASEDQLRKMLEISMKRPNVARVYDYFLGGQTNFQIDRDFAKNLLASQPDIPALAQMNRQFQNRAVRWAVDQGITQFIDVGAGIPTETATHYVVDAKLDRTCRVLYTDNDPIAHAHTQYLLEEDGNGQGAGRFAAACENFYDPSTIFREAEAQAKIDPSRPICLMFIALLYFTEVPEPALAKYRELLPPGSAVVISHVYDTGNAGLDDVKSSYQQTNGGLTMRTQDEIEALFGGWPLVDPGLVWMSDWKPDGTVAGEKRGADAPIGGVAGVALKP